MVTTLVVGAVRAAAIFVATAILAAGMPLGVAEAAAGDLDPTRYQADGALDPTFGIGGRVHTDFPVGQGGFATGSGTPARHDVR